MSYQHQNRQSGKSPEALIKIGTQLYTDAKVVKIHNTGIELDMWVNGAPIQIEFTTAAEIALLNREESILRARKAVA